MLADTLGKRINKYICDYVVFDLETTGLSTQSDRVVEISAVKVRGGEVVEEFSTLVNPETEIPPMVSSIIGITDEMVADAPVFKDALQKFLDFAGDMTLVGHNIHSFDMKFICRDAMEYWGQTVGNDYLDTLSFAKQFMPELSEYRLASLCDYFGISTEGAHRALNDCHMTRKVFENLREAYENPSEAVKALKTCPRCGMLLKKRNGMYGEFWGCTGYPGCRYTENIR